MVDYELRGTLKKCINTSYNRRDIHYLITTCHKLALSYVIMKSKSHKSYFLKEDCKSDLAWDFIAEIFQKDDFGNFTLLQSYFDSVDIDGFKDHELFIELRKLVFTKVDDGIFRYYGERDPSLKKIIRNLKLSVRNSDFRHKVQYEDGFIVVPNDEVQELPSMPEDFLRIKLCFRLEEQMQIPDILNQVVNILQDQSEYRNRFSLVILAKIIRESFVLIHDESETKNLTPAADKQLLKQDVEKFLNRSVNKIKKDVAPGYVKRGKIESDHVDIYFETATDIVRDDLTEQSGLSQFDRIKTYLVDLEYEQFRKKHRSVLEYMVKLIRTDLIQNVRNDWV